MSGWSALVAIIAILCAESVGLAVVRAIAARRPRELPAPELTCSYCEQPLSECDGCVRDATDDDGNVLT